MAPVQPEPLPPAGIGVEALHNALTALSPAGDAFFEWLSVAYPTWAHENAAQIAKAQTDCVAAEK